MAPASPISTTATLLRQSVAVSASSCFAVGCERSGSQAGINRHMATIAKPNGEISDGYLMRPRDAARLLGLSYPTLKQWIYKGKISTIKTAGGHYRIAASELDKFLFRRIERAPVAERRMGYRSISVRNQVVGRVSNLKLDGLLAQV